MDKKTFGHSHNFYLYQVALSTEKHEVGEECVDFGSQLNTVAVKRVHLARVVFSCKEAHRSTVSVNRIKISTDFFEPPITYR